MVGERKDDPEPPSFLTDIMGTDFESVLSNADHVEAQPIVSNLEVTVAVEGVVGRLPQPVVGGV